MEPGTVVRAVFEFLPSVSEELPLFAGDVIEVLSVVDEFWLLGNKDGVTGQFPSTFVEAVTIPSTKPGDRLYVCINHFSSGEPGTLSLKRGDVVAVEPGGGGGVDVDAAWRRGCNAWGARGLFPLSCLMELHLSGRSRLLSERSAQAQALDLPPHALGQARALMSLHAQLYEELDFRQGDLIIITGLPEPGWFQGEIEGRRGVFPEGFVELLGPLRSPQNPDFGDRQDRSFGPQWLSYAEPSNGGNEDEDVDEEDEVSAGEAEEHGEKEERFEGYVKEEEEEEDEEEGGLYGVALYEFRAMEPGELDFDVGDRILVLGTLEDGWLEGEVRGHRGVFPHRFVRMEDGGRKAAEETGGNEAEEEEEEKGRDICPSADDPEPDNGSDWSHYEDHTVWDLDYFERSEERRAQERGRAQALRRPPKPAPPAQQGPNGPGSAPPSKPRLPPRPSPPLLNNKRHVSMPATAENGDGSSYANAATATQQLKRIHSLTLPNNSRRRFKDGETYRRPPADGTAVNGKVVSLGKALVSIVEGQRRKKLTRHASVNDVDMVAGSADGQVTSRQPGRGFNVPLPGSFTFESLVSSASDLESKLSQQLFEFERSLTGQHDEDEDEDDAAVTSDGDPGGQPHVSRHYSILDYGTERDIVRGSSHAALSRLSQLLPSRGSSSSSSPERRKTLRPPPPRPRILRPPAPAPYRPARPAPRPPPPCPKPGSAPPSAGPACFYDPEREAEPAPSAESAPEESGELGDPAALQEQEAERRLEAEGRREEEQYRLLLRIEEVQRDMEEYAHTAEELRAMLEEEEEEGEEEEEAARLQAMENLEFCNYTLETLALELQHLQGEGGSSGFDAWRGNA